MKNFSVTVDGKEHWISRSLAVSGFIFIYDNGLKVLANKRGPGCPNHQGLWNCPCGYLDYDETLREACVREINEETNLIVNPLHLNYYNIDDSPNNKIHQNVTVSFWTFSQTLYKDQRIYTKGYETDEVSEVAWISIDQLDDFEWAFNHKYLIRSIALDYLRQYLTKEQRKRLKGMTNSD